MNKELKELLDKINAKKQEVKDLANADKLEEAKAAKEELIKMNDKFNILYDMFEEEQENIKENIKDKAHEKEEILNSKKELNAFVNALKAGLTGKAVSAEDLEIINSMSEGSLADGGLTVPQDIQTSVKTLRRTVDALEQYVNVEPVSTLSGSRVIEVDAEQVPFDNVDEEAEFPECPTPTFRNIPYKVKKKGGVLKVTRELLQDSAENIQAYLNAWIAKKAKVTRNFMILNQINTLTAGKEVKINGIDSLKDIFNVSLDPAIAVNSIAITNQDGFNVLDKIKDEKGEYILQKDPTQPTKRLLFGVYPVVVLSNRTIASVGGNAPIICGDLKEAITLFDRELLTIEINTQAGSLWNKDLTGIKVRERLDIQPIDTAAIVKGLIALTTSGVKGE